MGGELITFGALPIGAYFTCNGNVCIKNSTLTAKLTAYNRIFYFSKTETVALGYAGADH